VIYIVLPCVRLSHLDEKVVHAHDMTFYPGIVLGSFRLKDVPFDYHPFRTGTKCIYF
jgi:hypothetical protein